MGRKQAEALMDSTCVITRNGAIVTDPATGVDAPSVTTIYSGKCRLRMPNAISRPEAAAGQAIDRQSPELSIPVTASGSASVIPDDIAVITSALDAVTVRARISGVHSQTHSTARRFPLEVQS